MSNEITKTFRIVEMRYEAVDILSLVLRPLDESALPPVDPGSHIDLFLPDNVVRSYSLSNDGRDEGAYRVTIARDANSRGGSIYVHDTLRLGALLEVSEPRNNFHVIRNAPHSVFIAGGIGITPFLPMLLALNDAKAPWTLYYCAREPARAAFLSDLAAIAARASVGQVKLLFDSEANDVFLDLRAVLTAAPPGAHFYCCGPIGMLDAYRAAAETLGLDPERVHFEYFKAEPVGALEGGFVVELARTGGEIVVQDGQSILQALEAIGVEVPYSCEEGICGSCRTKVLAGVPDHRDFVLSSKERAANDAMMICCSGSLSDRLVLDL